MTLPVLLGDRVSSVSRRLDMAMAVVRSPFTGQDQSQDWGGRWWAYDVQLGPWRDPASKRATAAFFSALVATSGRFLFADPTAKFTGGYAALGTPLISGGFQAGRTLVTDGWTPFAVLKAGMCISFASGTDTRFHMLAADVVVSGGGVASLTISPGLREAPADNTPIEYMAPKVQLRVSSPVATQIATGAYYTFAFTAEESL
jgi:hypothetical protein